MSPYQLVEKTKNCQTFKIFYSVLVTTKLFVEDPICKQSLIEPDFEKKRTFSKVAFIRLGMYTLQIAGVSFEVFNLHKLLYYFALS